MCETWKEGKPMFYIYKIEKLQTHAVLEFVSSLLHLIDKNVGINYATPLNFLYVDVDSFTYVYPGSKNNSPFKFHP